MDEFLNKWRQKPDHHKKSFSFLVSGGFTAIIFLSWSYFHFGGAAAVVAEKVPDSEVKAVSPLGNLGSGLANAWSALKSQFKEGSATLESVDIENKYEQMRNDALNNQYGQ